jgi:hypothetical protein
LHHAGALGHRWSIRYIDQFEIEDQIGFGGNRWMGGVARGHLASAQSQLPGDVYAALTSGLHALESHIPTGERTALSHDQRNRLRIAQLGLAIVSHDGLVVLVQLRGAVIIAGVDLRSCLRYP